MKIVGVVNLLEEWFIPNNTSCTVSYEQIFLIGLHNNIHVLILTNQKTNLLTKLNFEYA